MAKGELVTLRCLRVTEILREELKGPKVTGDPETNRVTIGWPNGLTVVVQPVSVSVEGGTR